MVDLASIALVTADAWDMHDAGGGWWAVMMIAMVLFWGLVIAGVVWLVRGGLGGELGSKTKSASDVLDQRLAAGDISIEEYEQRRKALRGGNEGG